MGYIKIIMIILYQLVFLVLTNRISGQPSLKEVFKDNFMIGVALNNKQIIEKDSSIINLVEKQFNSITPENSLKWENIHPKENEYNFEPVDSLVAFGMRNNMFIIGHTLIWHSQVPNWIFKDDNGNQATRELLLKRMKDHIFSVVGRYKGRIKGWDVVNEAIEDNGKMRESKWYKIIGDDYIEKAFEWTHEADPDAELYYNDFNMWYKNKRKSVIKLVKRLKEKGIKINGIGMQGHWGLDYPPLSELDSAINAYSKLGVKLMITEFDLDMLPSPGKYTGAEISTHFKLKKELNPYVNGLPDSMQTVIANRYAQFFNIFNKYKNSISRITFWGVDDGQSWRNYWPIRGRTAYPLLFNRDLTPKPAFYSVIKTVKSN